MKSVLMSIKPKYCELIVSGEKTLEIRKSKPKLQPPFKCYVYCTKSGFSIYGDEKQYVTDYSNLLNEENSKAFEKTTNLHKWNGKVIGEFVCDKIDEIHISTELMYEKEVTGFSERTLNILNQSCLSYDEIIKYSGFTLDNYNAQKEYLYGWHISDLIIYDKPKELSEFMVIDKGMLKECTYRIRAYNNPDCTNGALLKGTYVCNNSFEPDFCRGQCGIATKPLTRPPQSWCYVDEQSTNKDNKENK